MELYTCTICMCMLRQGQYSVRAVFVDVVVFV